MDHLELPEMGPLAPYFAPKPIYCVCEPDPAVPFASEKMSVAVPLVGWPMKVAGRDVVKTSVFLV